jgi:hypothetical protein
VRLLEDGSQNFSSRSERGLRFGEDGAAEPGFDCVLKVGGYEGFGGLDGVGTVHC